MRITNYLVIPINWLFFYEYFKLFISPKKYSHLKKLHKIYYSIFFQDEIIGHTYICTNCNDNFIFLIL